GTPILFAKPDGTFDQSTIDYIARTRATSACILGGTAAVGSNAEATLEILSVPNVSRLYGASRYDTSLAICNAYRSLFTGNGTIIATGTSFPDALAGGAFGAKKGIPVVLVNPRARIANVANYLSGRTGTIYILGGTGAVSDKCVADYIR
ncbi:MAG: cell wall-binding repeat-containing protein, partial [Clostridia bacterium]|nr:cell wall-binding repeat-containing protein [Clostridia bacterium]